jgi:hypothetical protein
MPISPYLGYLGYKLAGYPKPSIGSELNRSFALRAATFDTAAIMGLRIIVEL